MGCMENGFGQMAWAPWWSSGWKPWTNLVQGLGAQEIHGIHGPHGPMGTSLPVLGREIFQIWDFWLFQFCDVPNVTKLSQMCQHVSKCVKIFSNWPSFTDFFQFFHRGRDQRQVLFLQYEVKPDAAILWSRFKCYACSLRPIPQHAHQLYELWK